MNVISAESSVLVLVDYQARLMPAIHDVENITSNAVLLAKTAHVLGIPVIGTEQNPTGLGQNVEQIRSQCLATITKTHFDACADGLLETLGKTKANCEIVIAGCESHVCLLQTALGLIRAGKRIWVVANASSSRRASDHTLAMSRLVQAGAVVVNLDMVLFEWLHDCRHPNFREVLKLVKAAGSDT